MDHDNDRRPCRHVRRPPPPKRLLPYLDTSYYPKRMRRVTMETVVAVAGCRELES